MLEKNVVEKVLDAALTTGADFAEIFVEDTKNSTIQFSDNKTKQSITGKDYGAGIRVIFGTSAIYGYTNDTSEQALIETAKTVASAGKKVQEKKIFDLTKKEIITKHPFKIDNFSINIKEKIDFIKKINKHARAESDKISQVSIRMLEKNQNVLIANSDGLWVTDERNYSRVYATAIATDGNIMQTGTEGPGGFAGYEFFNTLNPQEIAKSMTSVALTMLKADYAPSGKFPVVIDNGFGGVIFHEACGHALETTSVAKGASVFSGKLGEQIANPVVTAIDDGTMPNEWGSINIDDEGRPTEKTVLIQDGILKSYMIDKIGGIQMGMEPTGSGRRQSYKFAPASRMRNTYIAPGIHKRDDLINSIENGIYAKKMGGGSVVPGTGNFNFSIQEGYMIRNGKIAEPIRGATLIGNGADILHKISMVADNLALAEGMCGSVSGSIPTCVGQPAIKVDEIVVGGRKEA